LRSPPPIQPKPLGAYLWEPFNRPEHSVSLARDDDDFCRQDIRFTATDPSGDAPCPRGVSIKYHLHGHGSDESSLNGSAVISVDSLCPLFDAGTNQNMFQHLFGIEFHFENHTHVRGISPFEFARCFGFIDNLTHRLSHPACKLSLDSALPGQTSARIFEQVHLISSLCVTRTANYSHRTNGLLPQCIYNHSSTARSALGSLRDLAGLTLIRSIPFALLFARWY
jgi:hypothetical protein